MKRNYSIPIILLVLAVAAMLSSCKQPDECPPRNSFFAREVILPSPQQLTASDRTYLQELRAEYDENKDNR